MPLSGELAERLAMMEKKKNPEREAKDREFYELMQVRRRNAL